MKANKKVISIILIAIMSFLLVASIIVGVLFIPLAGEKHIQNWSSSDEFDMTKDAFTIEKTADEEFKILQLTDMQLWSGAKDNKETFRVCEELIRNQKPNLVVLSGDNVSGITAPYLLKDVIKFFDNLAIELDFYWAPVFGNHDNEIKATPNWSADQYIKANKENGRCLFAKGPSNLGDKKSKSCGNYVVNVRDNGVIVQSLYMLDTSYYIDYSKEERNSVNAKYDSPKYAVDRLANATTEEKNAFYDILKKNGSEKYITQNQIDWFKWNAENIKAINNSVEVPSLTFSHFAINGADMAFDELYMSGQNSSFSNASKFNITSEPDGYGVEKTFYNVPSKDANGSRWSSQFDCRESTSAIYGMGSYEYKPATPLIDTGFVTEAKKFGFYGAFFGHDHENDGVVIYDQVIYGYGLKAGPSPKPWNGSRYFGGSLLKFNSSTPKQLSVEHILAENANDWWNK